MSLLGIHLHSAPGDITVSAMMLWLNLLGGGAARLDTNWSDYQAPPEAKSFEEKSVGFDGAAYGRYLVQRGYGESGASLQPPLSALREAQGNKIRPVFNFGVIRDWSMRPRSDFAVGPAGERQWQNALADPATPGMFLHDFIVFAARQKDGIAVLENLAGWQMFNEVNGVYGERAEQLPRSDYFAIGEKTIGLVRKAYGSVGWKKKSKVKPPPVILPSLGGAHNPLFFDALIDHTVKDKTVAQANGGLALEAIAFHPYGMRIEPWLDPLTDESLGDETRDTMIYFRQLRPTDDRLTWQALVARDPTQSAALGLSLYSDLANPADGYFDRNSEQGTEQTMAQLAQNGYGHIRVHFTEWGQTTFSGDASAGRQSLWNTAFAEPQKYGVFNGGDTLPKSVAENLQAETVMQTIGLIESWDFVDTATVYEFFDQAQNEFEGEFGLARGVNALGQPDWKPAGLAFQAYLSGRELHLRDIVGATGNGGVDIHIAAAGTKGGFDHAARQPAAHELVLLRQGTDKFDSGSGDDVVFGGAGDDILKGDEGYDRLYGGPGNDVLSGGIGADKVKGDAGDDTLSGGSGADHFVFAAYAKSGSGFSGHDTITDFDVREDKLLITGGYRVADLLDGVHFPQLLRTEKDGVRIFYADSGASVLLRNVKASQLGFGNFHVLQSDRSVAFGRSENLLKIGGPAKDTLVGTSGADLIDGGRGADHMTGGTGHDTYVIDSIDDVVREVKGGGQDRIVTRVSIAALADHVEVVLLDSSKPIDATGNELDNDINGNGNRNVLRGGGGKDNLSGGAGRDTLDGGSGDDVLTGGAGNDDFVIAAGQGHDVITDFSRGDILHLPGFSSVDAALAAAKNIDGNVVFNLPDKGRVTLRRATISDLRPEDVKVK